MWTQELYGPEFKLFKVREARSAADVIAAHPEKEAGILVGGSAMNFVVLICAAFFFFLASWFHPTGLLFSTSKPS